MQCDIYSYGVILWEIITGAAATRGRLYEPEVRAVQSATGQHDRTQCRAPLCTESGDSDHVP